VFEGSDTELPSVLLWSNGDFVRKRRRGHVTPEKARSIAAEIAASLREPETPASGRIAVLSGERWRVEGIDSADVPRSLLALEPFSSFIPEAIAVEFANDDADDRWTVAPVAWPSSVPRPTWRALEGEPFVLPHSHRIAVNEVVGRQILIDGHRYMIAVKYRYHGQAAIDRVFECADSLRYD